MAPGHAHGASQPGTLHAITPSLIESGHTEGGENDDNNLMEEPVVQATVEYLVWSLVTTLVWILRRCEPRIQFYSEPQLFPFLLDLCATLDIPLLPTAKSWITVTILSQ